MLDYIITFFVLAIVAGLLGFGGLSSDFAGVAQLLTLVFVMLFIVSVVRRTATGSKNEPPL